jgi:hypothetical protein
MAKQTVLGVCGLCGVRKTKGAMLNHLKRCLPSCAKGGSMLSLALLRVEGAYAPHFWLDVAAPSNSQLADLDNVLRKVWLECCGHMSEFYAGRYNEIGMEAKISHVFGSAGTCIGYIYDWGSSTELRIRSAGFTEGTAKEMMVAARNETPVFPCDICGLPASSLCSDCQNSDEGFFCSSHENEHSCGEEMLLPVVNSPRIGVCAYSGYDR